mmetsp:Transcript_47002/g.123329  ORF Transcript_47002/g.123329 Transcript_47002/m.123329 type:complete len:546 (-) Transcript_47002:608-2245(-)
MIDRRVVGDRGRAPIKVGDHVLAVRLRALRLGAVGRRRHGHRLRCQALRSVEEGAVGTREILRGDPIILESGVRPLPVLDDQVIARRRALPVGGAAVVDVEGLALHHGVILEPDLVVPLADEVLEDGFGAGELEQAGEDGALREALAQQHARALRPQRHDVELLREPGDAAVSHDVGRVEAYDFGHFLGRLADVADADVVCEEAQANLGDVLPVAPERLNRRDRAIMQPIQVRRVQVVLDDVLVIAAIVKDRLHRMRLLGRGVRGQNGSVGLCGIAAPHVQQPLVLRRDVRRPVHLRRARHPAVLAWLGAVALAEQRERLTKEARRVRLTQRELGGVGEGVPRVGVRRRLVRLARAPLRRVRGHRGLDARGDVRAQRVGRALRGRRARDGVDELDGARPAGGVAEDVDLLLVHEARDLVREWSLHERPHRVCEAVHGLCALPELEDLCIEVGNRLGVDVEHDSLRDEHGGHVAAKAVLLLQQLEQRALLAVVQVESNPRRQPHVGVDFRLVALLHHALRLDRLGKVDLEEARLGSAIAQRTGIVA